MESDTKQIRQEKLTEEVRKNIEEETETETAIEQKSETAIQKPEKKSVFGLLKKGFKHEINDYKQGITDNLREGPSRQYGKGTEVPSIFMRGASGAGSKVMSAIRESG